jgi:hypothetical protein
VRKANQHVDLLTLGLPWPDELPDNLLTWERGGSSLVPDCQGRSKRGSSSHLMNHSQHFAERTGGYRR